MQIKIQRDLCVGTTACVDQAPDTYELGSDSIVKIKDGFDLTKASEEQKLKLIEGAKSCPVKALVIIDDEGKQVWPEPDKKAA